MTECLQNQPSDRLSDRSNKQYCRKKNEPIVCTFFAYIHFVKWMYAKKYRRSVRFCFDDFVCFSDPNGDRRIDSEGIRSYLSSHIPLIPIGSQESSPVVAPIPLNPMMVPAPQARLSWSKHPLLVQENVIQIDIKTYNCQ